ncbi:MAG: YfhO family protein [Candidatus Cloacimonetes bacterium]|nr:YfhO family protein [Candidatus Cloacimonadota bacterium]
MKKKKKLEPIVKRDFLEPLVNHRYNHLLFIGLILVLLSIFFIRMGYLGYAPKSNDNLQWRGAAEVQIRYNEENPDLALWNSNLFSGMPGYLISYPARYPFVKNIFDFFTTYLINWRVFYMFLAGLGMYILMLSLGFKPLQAFISGMAFALSCHFIGLIEIGHDTKYRAIIYIPWIFWAVNYLFKNRDLLGMGLTAMFLILQFRENHAQITYYTMLMILVYGIFSLFWHLKDYKSKEFLTAVILFVITLLIVGLAVAQPYLSVWEYGHYTIRGGDTGLGRDYATSWSFHPLEILTFIIPEFFGGISPFYWGWMPFTQTHMYMGIIIFALALLAIFHWKSRIVKMLTAVSLVSLFFSFGRHFPLLSNYLLSYFPFFNKFRVPAMILILLQFSMAILAGYGIKLIIDKMEEGNEKFNKLIRKLLLFSGIAFLLFVILSAAGFWNVLPFQHASDTGRYEPNQIDFLQDVRQSQFKTSGVIAFAFLTVFFLLTYLLLKRKGITPYVYMTILAVLVISDLMLVNRKHLKNLVPQQEIQAAFQDTEADRFLLEDEDLFRIYPIGGEFGQSRWAYYHQTIGGYHGAKLQRYQDILDHSLNAEVQYRVPINWNVVKMLNVKYLISPVQLPFDNLSYVLYDRDRRVTIYENADYLSRAWFVEHIEVVEESRQIFRFLNHPEFDPAKIALVEKPMFGIEAPEESSIELTDYGLHNIEFALTTDKNSLLVVSEIYYPAGWNAYLNGSKVEIIPVNHILRGVVIPPGEHLLEMRFEPASYRISLIMSLLGLITTVLLVIIGLIQYYRKNYRGEIVYVIKND